MASTPHDQTSASSGTAPRKRELALVSRSTHLKEKALQYLFFACAFLAVVTVILIFAFTMMQAAPVFTDIGLANFFSFTWAPTEGHYGIMSLAAGTALVTVGALVLGVPLGVGTAVYLTEIASARVRALISPAVDLLAGIPSIIYGFFGMVIIRPFVAEISGGLGFGALTAWFVLAIMIVPTITTLTIDALNSIPMGIREASFAMGATKWQVVSKIVLPSAFGRIATGIVLGIGRAIGETAVVLYTMGQAINMPITPFDSGRPMTVHLYLLANDGINMNAAYGTAFLLMVIILAFNLIARRLSRKNK